MEFWNELITKKSWEILLELNKKPVKFILIGGWAAYLLTKLHKSRDIDIVITDYRDLDYLKKNYELKKNVHLKKYEIIIEGVDIDIYAPHFSKLAIPPEDLIMYTLQIENITTIKPEVLLILKQGAELERRNTIKGQKDQIDIITLLIKTEISWQQYYAILKKYNLVVYIKRLKEIIKEFRETKYLLLNPRQFKLKKNEILKKIDQIKR